MSYPTDLDAFTNPGATEYLGTAATVGIAAIMSNLNDAVEEIEAKVGIDSSAVATSIDYLLKNSSSSNPGHKHTSAGVSGTTGSGNFVLVTSPTLATPTLTSPVLNTGVSGTAIDTDGTLAGNSDTKVASQKATKTYVDNASSTTGWITISATLAYSSADDPVYVITSTVDLTGSIGLGDKIKFTNNSTTFYGFVVAIAAGTITLYGGSDYDVANSAITSPYYSKHKSPLGFPTRPDKWTQQTTDTSSATQATPTGGTWYNLGSLSLSIPIGAWYVEYFVLQKAVTNSGTATDIYTTLSTANNSESDVQFSTASYLQGASGAIVTVANAHRMKVLVLTSKTAYYLNAKSSIPANNIYHSGDIASTIIRAVCAYL